MNHKPHPPRLAQWLLYLFSSTDLARHRFGDLEEVYCNLLKNQGLLQARLWYWSQVIRSLPMLLLNSIFWSWIMFQNYLKTAIRNIRKHKSFTAINISGLAIGLASCLILTVYIYSELSYDSYHLKKDRIFRVCEDMSFKNFSAKQSSTNGVIAAALKESYPEVEETARFRYKRSSLKVNNKEFSERLYYTDNGALDIFSWPMIEGDQNRALESPYSIVLTEETAKKYFPDTNPLGQLITLNDTHAYKVTGVIADLPQNSTLRFQGLCSFSTLYKDNNMQPRILDDWTSHNFNTYVLLREGVEYQEFQKKIEDIYYDYAAEELEANGSSYAVFLQPIKDIYLRPLREDFGPIVYVYIFAAVALFILLIACVNFMNLSTARSMTRAREVGVRKVFGANRQRLIKQFLTEAVILSAISMLIALVIATSILPMISELAGRDLTSSLFEIPWMIPGLFLTMVMVGLMAGSYPAIILSRFQAAEVIRNKLRAPRGNVNLRRALVIFQFVISISLIIGTVLVVEQLDYLKSKDAGFDKEHVVCLSVREESVRNMLPVIKKKFTALPEVISSGASSRLPGWSGPMNSKIPEGYDKEDTQLMRDINVDESFLSTLGVKFVVGRNFSNKFPGDAKHSVIVNQTAVKKFGWENPIGKTIRTLDTTKPDEFQYIDKKVIGVVEDFHLSPMTREIQPFYIANETIYPYEYGKLHVLATRIQPGETRAILEKMESVWKATCPDKTFSYYFLDDDFNEQFLVYERSRNILSYFTGLAIFIACLGLFGMVAYAAEKRTKEIGIRKTLGSSVAQIVGLLSKELILLVLIANFIAYPIAYLLINQWLVDFPYRIEIGINTFIFSTLLALFISFITISYQSVKAALANPIKALKYE